MVLLYWSSFYSILYLAVDIIYFILIIFFGFYLLNFTLNFKFLFPIFLFIILISAIYYSSKKKWSREKNYEQKYYTDTLNILQSILEIQTYKKIAFFADSFSRY